MALTLVFVFSLSLLQLPAHARRLKVESTVLAAVDYRKKAKTLDVEFRGGPIYRYFDVPLAVYKELMAADSKGSYYFHSIRDRYRWERVRPQSPSRKPAAATVTAESSSAAPPQ